MTHESLARKLRILRAARGITLAEAEELTGVTRETLGALEHGQRGAYTSTLEKIARGYGVTVSALLSEVEEPEAELALAGSSPGKVEAPREAGRLSAIDVAKDAARRQIALEKQAMFGGALRRSGAHKKTSSAISSGALKAYGVGRSTCHGAWSGARRCFRSLQKRASTTPSYRSIPPSSGQFTSGWRTAT